jgi:nucleotide-binding universal stress UspA family protein
MLFDSILVAIDGSTASDHALRMAVELAALTGARLTALAVEGPLPAYAATVGEVEEAKHEKDADFGRLAARAQGVAERAGVELHVDVRAGHAAELIVRSARELQVDLVVVGHRGHALRDHLLGSTASRVAEHAECPVMIVR